MVADGELHRVHRGIYVDGKATPDSFARALTQSLADVALTGHSATQKHLGQKLTFPLELEGPRTIRGKKFQVKHTRRHTTQVIDGVRVVEPLWAASTSKYERGWLLERYYRHRKAKARRGANEAGSAATAGVSEEMLDWRGQRRRKDSCR